VTDTVTPDTTTPPAGPALDTGHPGWSFQMMIDPEFAADPRPYFDRLRSTAPVRDEFAMEDRKPTVLVSRYEHVEAVLRNAKLFSSRFGDGMSGLGNDRPMIPLQVDPPEHKKYRVLLDPYLAPRQVAKMEPEVTQLVNELIDRFEARGSCEFNAEFAVPLPCTVFLALLGLPLADLDFFLRVKEGIVRGNGERTIEKQFEARSAAGKECYAYFDRALDRILRDRTPGLLLDLMEAEVDGERLTRDEIMDICYLFIIAGLDTVTDSLCCFWTYLARHPEHRREIVDDPAIIPAAVEELMRWESPTWPAWSSGWPCGSGTAGSRTTTSPPAPSWPGRRCSGPSPSCRCASAPSELPQPSGPMAVAWIAEWPRQFPRPATGSSRGRYRHSAGWGPAA
jgi:cytochrome P450